MDNDDHSFTDIFVKRARVMRFLKELDPEGVESRKKKRLRRRLYHAKGPNFVWYIDGHDKLKPYGFSIPPCIDGFSRRLIWLEIGPTNKKPDVIAKYYLDAVKQAGGVPRKIRSDDGTENCLIEAIHMCLRAEHSDEHTGLGSFTIGRSTANQRIEAYWSHLVKDGPGWWMNFFKDMLTIQQCLFQISAMTLQNLLQLSWMNLSCRSQLMQEKDSNSIQVS